MDPPACAAHHYETGLIYQAKQAGVEVYPSIGGWTLSDNFPVLAASEAARTKFAEQCVALIRNYDFDGVRIILVLLGVSCLHFIVSNLTSFANALHHQIDIDWEYPGYAPQ